MCTERKVLFRKFGWGKVTGRPGGIGEQGRGGNGRGEGGVGGGTAGKHGGIQPQLSGHSRSVR
jgi:hypothetical protein